MTNKLDSLGDRMKRYENKFRTYLPDNSYVIIRIDGRHFHSYTRGLEKPFDGLLIDAMDYIMKKLCESVSNCYIGYTQSDEISLVLSDTASEKTQPFFANNLQKIVTSTAAIATGEFLRMRLMQHFKSTNSFYPILMDFQKTMQKAFAENLSISDLSAELEYCNELVSLQVIDELEKTKIGTFDSRAFAITPNIVKGDYSELVQIPTEVLIDKTKYEVVNYLLWRMQDCTRNSVSSLAQSMFSHKQLQNQDSRQMKQMCEDEGNNWNELNDGLKYGRFCFKVEKEKPNPINPDEQVIRKEWEVSDSFDINDNSKPILNILPDATI